MQGLTIDQKLKYIKETAELHGITSYKISQETPISDLGVRNILEGKSKNPRAETINEIYNYIISLYPHPETSNSFIDINALADTVILYHNNLLKNPKYLSFIQSECGKLGHLDAGAIQSKFKEYDKKLLQFRENQRAIHDKTLQLEQELINLQSGSNAKSG
jgi:transcriptional regulator with XRE-family HTH domain